MKNKLLFIYMLSSGVFELLEPFIVFLLHGLCLFYGIKYFNDPTFLHFICLFYSVPGTMLIVGKWFYTQYSKWRTTMTIYHYAKVSEYKNEVTREQLLLEKRMKEENFKQQLKHDKREN